MNDSFSSNTAARLQPALKISVIIPCRNEERFISHCLDSVIKGIKDLNSYEILVIDGMSQDATRQIVAKYTEKFSFIYLIDNPQKIVPTALNRGISLAKGEIIVRLDSHAEYPANYISDCIALLERSNAQNAGGRVIPVYSSDGCWVKAIARVTSSRFGVGNGAFRTSNQEGFVDTVPFGVFRRYLFDQIGYFDERLTRNQDNEFNARIRKHGGKIAFDPKIKIFYKNQSRLSGLLHQAFYTSMWNVYTLWMHRYTFQWRRFVPLAFVIYLTSLLVSALTTTNLILALYSLPLFLYLTLCCYCSFDRKAGIVESLRNAATFVAYHLAYGCGTLFGIFNLLSGRWKKYIGKPLKK